jgi:hypothetical protein
MTDLKLCKDCKHYKKNWFEHLTGGGDRFDMCLNPVVSGNLVTGKVKGGRFCDMMRLSYGKCGEEGKYFEPKRTS